MTLNAYLWGMRIITVAMLAVWGSVVYFVDPNISGVMGEIIFFTSLLLAMSGVCILFLNWIKRLFFGKEEIVHHLGINFRQGILIAIAIIAILILQRLKFLIWWDALLVIGAIFLIELYFLSHSKE
jgi:hypothetical protein